MFVLLLSGALCVQSVSDAVFSELCRDNAFRLSGLLGLFEHSVYDVVDVVHLLEDFFLIICSESFLACIDYAASVYDEVRGI